MQAVAMVRTGDLTGRCVVVLEMSDMRRSWRGPRPEGTGRCPGRAGRFGLPVFRAVRPDPMMRVVTTTTQRRARRAPALLALALVVLGVLGAAARLDGPGDGSDVGPVWPG